MTLGAQASRLFYIPGRTSLLAKVYSVHEPVCYGLESYATYTFSYMTVITPSMMYYAYGSLYHGGFVVHVPTT